MGGKQKRRLLPELCWRQKRLRQKQPTDEEKNDVINFSFHSYLSLDILASNNSFVNLTMFTWGHWSKTLKSQPEPVGLNLLSKSDSTLCRLIDEFNMN